MTYEDDRRPTQITTRIPAELADDLYVIANIEKRSLSNLLLLAVEDFIANYKANYKSRATSEG